MGQEGGVPKTRITTALRLGHGDQRSRSSGASLARDGAQLLLQASLVYVHPAFDYLVLGNAEEAHPGKRHVSASWCDAHELTLVGTATPPAYYHLVSFGHYVLHSILDVWKGAAVNGDVVLELFDAPLLLAGQMVDELSAKYLVCRIEISSAEKVLEPASCERLVLFRHLFLRFARRPPSGRSCTE